MTQFALIDCNNFFVSCERLFRPDLEGRPVVVLSSNDGCAVSRSNEAKALGIPMGAPAFKYKELFARHKVQSFSANFDLYGDISQRLVALLTRVTPRIEVYSVDESFLDLSELAIDDYEAWGRELRAHILRDIGIPVSVGIAPTKTLAKLANHRAKQTPALRGALAILDAESPSHHHYYTETPVADIWGVGRRLSPKLKAEGIHTAADLRHMYPPRARQLMGKHGAQMIAELNGIACLPLETANAPHQTIMRGRTLGQEVRDQHALEAAIATLSARAAYCLRSDHQLVRSASLTMSTNKHKPGYRRLSETVRFTTPTSDTGTICLALTNLLSEMYNPHVGIYRVSVSFHELVPEHALKLDLFGEVNADARNREQARMTAFDAINDRYGKGAVRSAAEDLSQAWRPRQGSCSPHYTTRWQDIPVARL